MTRAVVASVLVAVAVSAAAAQQPPPSGGPAPPQVFRSRTNLVPLSVAVTDGNRQFVRGLTADDFAVFEDGVRQQVQFFETSEMPLDLILMLDTSSSMADKLHIVHEAAAGFLRSLRDRDRGAVITFADGVKVLQELTSDRGALEGAVRQTAARGATSLHNALYVSLKQFGGAAAPAGHLRRRAIAVLSDGEDTSSLVPFEDVLALARRSGVAIYPISVQSEYAAARLAAAGQRRTLGQAEYSLRVLAQETGGQAFFPGHIHELKDVYASIAHELSCQYALAYAPANTAADGRFRRIVVRVTARPELKLRTRSGYVADLAAGMPMPPAADHQR